jgi:hypothetical protein
MSTLSAPVFYAVGHDDRLCIDAHMRVLADQMRRCGTSHGRWFSLRCLGDHLRALAAPRFVSVVLLSAVIVGGVSLMG